MQLSTSSKQFRPKNVVQKKFQKSIVVVFDEKLKRKNPVKFQLKQQKQRVDIE